MVERALKAADKLKDKGISVEVIDPRTLVPFDKQAIIDSVRKTGRLVIMDEEPETGSAASQIAASVGEVCPKYPDTFQPGFRKLLDARRGESNQSYR